MYPPLNSSHFADIYIHVLTQTTLFADADPELDSLTQMCIELLTHSIMLILDRQAKDQLPGGKYSNPTDLTLALSNNLFFIS
jgi:E1A/CREB-binding protein